MKYPVRKIVYPKDLVNETNGKVHPSLLKRVKPSGELHHLAATAWSAMQEAAKKESVILTHTGAYRSYLKQHRLFRLRYSPRPTGRIPQVTRSWKNKTWYLRKGFAPAASPGSSNHGLGLSVDVALKVSNKTVSITADPDADGPLKTGSQWLQKNAVSFGWCWEVADSNNPNFEIWHLVYFSGDNTPPAVIAHNTPQQ